jgi:CheY-like chemotaxis protein
MAMGERVVSYRILIIDDEEDIREVAALSLESVAGWEVILAGSGAQGLARAIEHKPDAILLDVMMPGMDGPSTFRELRNNPATAKIPVLLLTAKVQSSDQRRFADLGVEGVLFKPFDPMTLHLQVSAALGWK